MFSLYCPHHAIIRPRVDENNILTGLHYLVTKIPRDFCSAYHCSTLIVNLFLMYFVICFVTSIMLHKNYILILYIFCNMSCYVNNAPDSELSSRVRSINATDIWTELTSPYYQDSLRPTVFIRQFSVSSTDGSLITMEVNAI